MATRWMVAGAMLAGCFVGCSTKEETPPSEPAPAQVSDKSDESESPFKAVESEPIEDMQPAVVVDNGPKRVEPEPAPATPAAPPMSIPEPVVSTTRPVEPPIDPVPRPFQDRGVEEDKEPDFASDNDRPRRPRRRRPLTSSGAAASPIGPVAGSPVFSAIPSGGGLGAGAGAGAGAGGSAGFGEDAMGPPEFGSGEMEGGEGSAGGAGLGPGGGHGIALSGIDIDFNFGDDLAQTTDGLGPGGGHGPGSGHGAGSGHGGPVDGGLSPAPPVPPPDF